MTLWALSLWRPWDEAVLLHTKACENRGWVPPARMLGQYIALQAAQKYHVQGMEQIEAVLRRPGVRADHFNLMSRWHSNDSRAGRIVGVARLVGWLDKRPLDPAYFNALRDNVVAMPEYRPQVDGLDRDPWWMGPVGWLLVERTPIEPVLCTGRQGLWRLDAPTEDRVRFRWMQALRRRGLSGSVALCQ